MDRHGVLVRRGSSQGLMLHCSGIDRLEQSVSCPASCALVVLMTALAMKVTVSELSHPRTCGELPMQTARQEQRGRPARGEFATVAWWWW